MCAIFGALIRTSFETNEVELNAKCRRLLQGSINRGRDGRGYVIVPNGREIKEISRIEDPKEVEYRGFGRRDIAVVGDHVAMIGNTRAEPTTEFVKRKTHDDQQPYSMGDWSIVHNGTIANDKVLRTNKYASTIDSAAIIETLYELGLELKPIDAFVSMVKSLKGSYAILAVHNSHPDHMFFTCNYRPIWYKTEKDAVYFASESETLGADNGITMIPPYSVGMFNWKNGVHSMHRASLYNEEPGKEVLVVCSGGLDSVVAASALKAWGYTPTLLHFTYGCRAEGKEVEAIENVAKFLDAKLIMQTIPIYRKGDSNLFNDGEIAGGESGAEYAHEWVPARNLVMLSIAAAIAESRNINYIALGNNLEEAGAYPDNEPEFIKRLNQVLPFATHDGFQLEILMPVGNLMKHEIVKLGLEVKAPMHLTWSCYRQGELHCGKCGPCFMRRTAFEINNQPEVIEYELES